MVNNGRDYLSMPIVTATGMEELIHPIVNNGRDYFSKPIIVIILNFFKHQSVSGEVITTNLPYISHKYYIKPYKLSDMEFCNSPYGMVFVLKGCYV